MNIANSKSALVNNSCISDTREKICNCLGCNKLADTDISLKIGEKSIMIRALTTAIQKGIPPMKLGTLMTKI